MSVRTIERAVADIRRAQRVAALATVRVETAPGDQLQIDFGQKRRADRRRQRSGSFSWSRCSVTRAASSSKRFSMSAATIGARASPRPSRTSAACRGRCSATMRARWCSVATARPAPSVSIRPTSPSVATGTCSRARARPYRARTKGKTEAGVKYVKRNALADQAFDSFAALEQHLAAWMTIGRSARATARPVKRRIVRFERDERAALRPLPLRALPRRTQRLRRRVALDAFVDVDTVRYSVPHRLVRDHVEVVVEEQLVRIFHGTELVATHARSTRAVCPRGRCRRITPACGASALDARAPTPPALALLGRDLADYAAVVGRWPMSVVIHARVVEQLTRLRLRYVAERLDAVLNDAARDRADLSRFPRRRPAAGGRRQAAHARRDGAEDRALPDGEDARRLRFQIPAVGRSATRPRAGDGALSRAKRKTC